MKPRCTTECAEDIRRLESEKVAILAKCVEPRDAFAWLIEAPGPRYLAARKVTTSHDFVWHADANFAVRFYSEEQADLTMMAIRQLAPDLFGFERTLGNAKPVEHGWIAAQNPL